MAKCIVLRSSTPYSEQHEPLLREVLDEAPSLFAVVGAKSQSWEDAMARTDRFCKTTSHTQESFEEVVAYVEQWCELRGLSKEIRVMEI